MGKSLNSFLVILIFFSALSAALTHGKRAGGIPCALLSEQMYVFYITLSGTFESVSFGGPSGLASQLMISGWLSMEASARLNSEMDGTPADVEVAPVG